jgi:hypothetical protein
MVGVQDGSGRPFPFDQRQRLAGIEPVRAQLHPTGVEHGEQAHREAADPEER